jgi:membrane protease YdiL (CAAX protease family)
VSAPPPPTAVARIRWGLPDVAVAWLIGIVASVIAAVPFVDANGKIPKRLEIETTLVLLAVQNIAVVIWLVVVARRKGLGSLRRDFGLWIEARDLAWLPVGIIISFAAGLLLLPITELAGLDDSSQDVVRTFERSSGALEIVLFVIGVVVVAPVVEELLFRGALLRALLRKTSPRNAVFVSALLFALVHFLGDPGTGYYVPAFLLLGLVSGWRSIQTGRLGQSICLHAGFNLVAAILILA